MTRNPSNRDCLACCDGIHDEEEACDQCPFIKAGEEANFILKVFRISCSKQTDKDKISRWYFDPDRMLFAYATFNIEDKEAVFRYVAHALRIFNGESELLDGDASDMNELK